jgi:hypothetical protein
MIRRFNYTGRKKIAQVDVPIILVGDGQVKGFQANLGALADAKYGLPKDARVFVEAYERTAYMRFDFGTTGAITPPTGEERLLSEFQGSSGVRFRVKVVDCIHDAQLLAEADGILPLTPEESEQNKVPLLPVRPEDLGQEVWRIEFPEGMQDRPILLVNINAGDSTAVVRSPAFMSLAWPAVLRQILTRILIVDGQTEMDDEEDWHCLWLQYARRLLPTHEAPPQEEEQRAEWIDGVIEAFCSKLTLLTKYKESEEEANAVTT